MDVEPSWSPDGNRLAIATSDATGQDFDIATIGAERLEPEADHERRSLGREARLVAERQVDRLRERPRRELRHLPHPPERNRAAPADVEHLRGHRPVVVAGRVEDRLHEPARWLPARLDDERERHGRAQAPKHGGWSPAWSPDGKTIAFVGDDDGDNEIYTVGADGKGVTQLTDEHGHHRRQPDLVARLVDARLLEQPRR